MFAKENADKENIAPNYFKTIDVNAFSCHLSLSATVDP